MASRPGRARRIVATVTAIVAGLALLSEALRWLAIGVLVALLALICWYRISHRDPTLQEPRRHLWVAGLLPLFPLVALATYGYSAGLEVLIAAALTVGAWFAGVQPAFSSSGAAYWRRDLLAVGTGLGAAIASAASGTPASASLLFACLVLWLGRPLAGLLRLTGRSIVALWRLLSRRPPRPALAPTLTARWRRSTLAFRWYLLAALAGTASLLLANLELTTVNGPLAKHIDAIVGTGPTKAPKHAVAALQQTGDGLHDNLLAHLFAPHMFLSSDQQIWPAHPLSDVLRSTIYSVKGRSPGYQVQDPNDVPAHCADGKRHPCYVLSDKCFEASPRCGDNEGQVDPFSEEIHFPGTQLGILPTGVVYVRIVHRPRKPSKDKSGVFRDVGLAQRHFPGKPITTLLEYWFYYRYDSWVANTAFGKLVQEHESDWEGMTVGLSADTPLFVAYSSHCGGQWLPWSAVPTAPEAIGEERFFAQRPIYFALGGGEPGTLVELSALDTLYEAAAAERGGATLADKTIDQLYAMVNGATRRRANSGPFRPEPLTRNQFRALFRLIGAAGVERTHPAVMVAAGSQGTYPLASHPYIPDWTTCVFKRSWSSALTLAAGASETVNIAEEVAPAGYGLYGASIERSPMDFAGYWGYNNRKYLELPFGIDIPISGSATTPGIESPPFQPNWSDPFGQIFHSRTWHEGPR